MKTDGPSHNPLSLNRLQRWMQSVITHPEGVANGIDSASAREHIDIATDDVESVITRSQQRTSIQRLHVYANAYYLRLLECLQDAFPSLSAALGNDAFEGLAFGYLQHYPSTSYTLGELGRNFPQYLAETRPPREGDEPDWADFLIELAELELLYYDIFDGPGIEKTETLSADELACIPPVRWNEVCLEPAPCLRLASFRFPVQEYASAVRNTKELPEPQPQETFLAISRIDYRVRRWSLDREQFRLLEELCAGKPLLNGLETTFAASNRSDGEIATDLREWFTEWASSGFFVGIASGAVDSDS